MNTLTPRVWPGQLLLAAFACSLVLGGWLALPHPLLAVAVGLAPLLAMFVLKQPYFVVLLFVLFSFFRLHEAFPQLYTLRIPLSL